jgi:large subunit ribosomal protein L32
MANPKKKHSPARRDSRRSANWKLEMGSLSKCPQCGVAIKPHHVCPACGHYKGVLVLAPRVKKKKEGE